MTMIWFLVVLGLAIAWWLLRQRTPPNPRAKSLPDPRALLARELRLSAAAARKEGRYAEAQAAELRAGWLRTDPPLGQDAPPSEFDAGIYSHLQLVDDIRERYAATLARPDDFSDCTYKPAALLPYPKDVIRRALVLIIGIGEGSVHTPHVDAGAFTESELATMKASVQLLDSYLDVPAGTLPATPDENEVFGRRFKDTMRT